MGRSEFDKLIEELELTPFVFFIIRRIYRGDKSVQNVITKCRIMRRISFRKLSNHANIFIHRIVLYSRPMELSIESNC